MLTRVLGAVGLVCSILLVSGCSYITPPDVVEGKGKVLDIDGKPLEGVTVTASSEMGMAQGVTNAAGEFELSVQISSRAFKGTWPDITRFTFTKFDNVDSAAGGGEAGDDDPSKMMKRYAEMIEKKQKESEDGKGMDVAGAALIPGKYGNPETSGFEHDFTKGPKTDLEFKLDLSEEPTE